MARHEGLPLIDAHRTSAGVMIRCPICGETHYHGRPERKDNPEHRAAHCAGAWADDNEGYYIIERSEQTETES